MQIVGPKKSVKTYAFLDDGSTITLINEELARNVGLNGKKIEMSIFGIKGDRIELSNCRKVDVDLLGAFGIKRIEGAVTTGNARLPVQSLSNELIKQLKLPDYIAIDPYYDAQVEILIGQDNWSLLTSSKTITSQDYNIAISRTPLGWAVHGPTLKIGCSPREVCCSQQCTRQAEDFAINSKSRDEELDSLVKHFFNLESIGVDLTRSVRTGHERSWKILEETSCFKGDRWETGLLWKRDQSENIDSYPTALKRLRLLESRIDRDHTYGQLYYAEMDRFIRKGYAVKIDKSLSRDRLWYIPHFGVHNVNKPNKIRLVFDSSAKTQGVSLSDQLDAGPDLLMSLPGVLIRFRQHEVAFKGDVSDMFLRVGVREEDRGAQRFLWRGACRDGDPDIYEMNTLIFGNPPSPCSAIYIKNRNAETFKIKGSYAHVSLKKNFYMDDFLGSCKTVSDASKLVKEVIAINSMGGFEMHGWASSHSDVLPQGCSLEKTGGDESRLCDNGGERVLGLKWDKKNDRLKFDLQCKKISNDLMGGIKTPTKREVLRVVMSVFDPLGLLSPFTLKAKILLQEIWRSGVNWDDKIRNEERAKWISWLHDLGKISDCWVSRCMTGPGVLHETAQLHIFCDASLTAFSAVAYLRFDKEDGSKHVALMMAKSRIAPLKTMTVPRLELQAALLGTRLAKFIKDECEFDLKHRIFWSDSKTVISWIKSEPRSRTVFVAHRLGEISELTGIS